MLAGALVPLAFHTMGVLGFEATKILFTRVLALMMIGALLVLEVTRIGADSGPFAWARPARMMLDGPARWVLIGASGTLAASVVATAFSVAPMVSLLGSWDRGQGLVTTAAWIVLGIVAAIAGRHLDVRRSLLTIWCAASIPVCLYALAQAFRLDPVNWLNQQLGVASTLGSSTALATYLAMLIPLTLGCAAATGCRVLSRPRRPRRGDAVLVDARLHFAAWIAILVGQVLALAVTQVRGGLLAVGAAVVVAVSVALWPTHRRAVAIGGSAALAALAVAAGLLAVAPRPDVGDGADTSARQRLLIWQDALTASVGPRVLVGDGPETQMLSLEPAYPRELAQRFEHVRYDRAHNLILDTVLTTGVLGVAALGTLVVGLARLGAASAAMSPTSERWIVAGLLGALVGNLAANLVAFDSATTGLLFWLVAGLLVGPSLPAAPPVRPPVVSRREERRRRAGKATRQVTPPVRLRATGLLAIVAVGLATVPWLTGHFLADLYHTRALAYRAGEAPAASSRQELAAARSAPWLDLPALALGDVFVDLARTTTVATSAAPPIASFESLEEIVPASRAAQFEAAQLAYERAERLSPADPYTHAALARYWVVRARATRDAAERTTFYGQAVEAYDRAIARGPSRVAFYDEAGEALVGWGRPVQALERFEQAEALTRPTAERLSRMGTAEIARGEIVAARALYVRALTLDDRSAPAEAGLAALERAAGRLDVALEHAQRAARFQMRNWIYQRDLALIQQELGQLPDALATARAARRLAPAWEEPDLTALVQSLTR